MNFLFDDELALEGAKSLNSLMEELVPAQEISRFANVHNATAVADNLLRREFFITFDGKQKRTVKFAKSFIGAMDEFLKRECSEGKPIAVNRWRLFPGHHEFQNQKWFDKNKDRKVYVWNFWTAKGFVGSIIINPILMQAFDPIDYRMKGEERHVDSRCSMSTTTLKGVIHKTNALLTH